MTFSNLSGTFLLIIGFLFQPAIFSQNPAYLLELRNDVQVSTTVYEFDIYLLRTGTIDFEYSSGQYGIIVNPLIKNGGTITASIISGSSDPALVAKAQNPVSATFADASNSIRIAGRTPPGSGNGTVISSVPPGTRICRIRLSNTNIFGQYKPDLTWTTTTIYPTQVYAYVNGLNTPITSHANHTISNLLNPILNVVTSADQINAAEAGMNAYPNPFSDRITIDYTLPRRLRVIVSILDSSGRTIDEIVNETQDSGSHSVIWTPSNPTGGIYYIKLQAGTCVRTAKVTNTSR